VNHILRNIGIYLFFITLGLTGCEQDDILNPNKLIPDKEEMIEWINYEMISVDTVKVFFSEDAQVASKYFKQIIISHKNKYFEYVPLDTITPLYKKTRHGYLMSFSEKFTVPDLSESYFNLDFKFMLSDKDFRIVDLRVELFKYAFATAKFYFDLESQSCEDQSGFIQGFDIDGSSLYFHLSGPSGVYRYNTAIQHCNQVVTDYLSGDWLCTNDGDLYIDLSHNTIIRINMDSVISSPILIEDIYWTINGMDIYNNILYVLSNQNNNPNNNQSNKQTLSKFNLEGSLISSEPFDSIGWSISIYENYLYTLVGDRIARFNLFTKEYDLVNLKPGIFLESIQVINGLLYYSDYRKHNICYLPLSDVFEN
jgi:hypothetical protein